MSKHFEEFSKDLARGMSRRTAFVRLGIGLGAAVLGLFTRKPAAADSKGSCCAHFCQDAFERLGFSNVGECVSECVRNPIFNATCA